MKAHLSDGRNCWSGQPLGVSAKWSLTKRGMLTIRKTDLGYRITLTLNRVEMEELRSRLNEVLDGKPAGATAVLREAESILNQKKENNGH